MSAPATAPQTEEYQPHLQSQRLSVDASVQSFNTLFATNYKDLPDPLLVNLAVCHDYLARIADIRVCAAPSGLLPMLCSWICWMKRNIWGKVRLVRMVKI